MNEFEWPEYCVNICKVAGAKTMIEKTQLLTWLSLLTNAGYTLLTPEEQDFILTEPEKYPVFSWVYEWLNILTFEKFLLII